MSTSIRAFVGSALVLLIIGFLALLGDRRDGRLAGSAGAKLFRPRDREPRHTRRGCGTGRPVSMSAVTKALLVLLATVAIALLSPSAASAEQKVTFPATSAGTGAATPIQGYLSRPPGQGPFAAVVVLHSCLGLRADRPAIARMLNGWGYVALFVDDFSTRGLEETCAVDFPEGLADAYGALAYLAGLADVDTTRVAALGYSQGADTALRVSAGEGSFALPKGAGFRTAAAVYPPCENENQEHARLRLPTLILVGGADTVTPASACKALVDRQPAGVATLVVYPGAAHVFDDPAFAGGKTFMGMRLQYDRAAARRAQLALRAFLAAQLGR